MTKIWSDNPAGLYTKVPVVGPASIGDSQNPLLALFVKDLTISGDETLDGDSVVTGSQTAEEFLLIDGSDKNHSLSVYAAGTAYSLTATAAALNFGTTDPVLTLDKAGTYLLFARAVLDYVGATFAASQAVTLKLRRTNNTPADLSNGSVVVDTDTITTLSYTFGTFVLPPVVYTTPRTDDAITIFGDVAVLPSAGSLDAVAAEIVAVRLY